MLSELAFCKLDLLYRNTDKRAVEAECTGAERHDCSVCDKEVLCPRLRFVVFYS